MSGAKKGAFLFLAEKNAKNRNVPFFSRHFLRRDTFAYLKAKYHAFRVRYPALIGIAPVSHFL